MISVVRVLSRLARVRVAAGLLCVLSTKLASANPAFETWANDFAREWSKAEPVFASYTQYLPREEQAELDGKLAGPHGHFIEASAREARAQLAERGLAELAKWSDASLTPAQRVSAKVIRWYLANARETERAGGGAYVFDQFWGQQILLTMIFNQIHPLRDAADLANYFKRLDEAAPSLDAGILEAKARAEKGMIPPRFIIDATLRSIDLFLAEPAAKNPLVVTLRERLSRLEAIPRTERDAAVERAERTVERDVLPAYRRVKALLLAQRERATNDAGLSARPGGAEIYRVLLESSTTTKLSPEQIHAIGLREVQRIEADMDRELRGLGYKDGTLNERVQRLTRESQPPADPDPRPMLLAQIEGHVRDAEQRARALFDLRPKAPIEIKRVPHFTEKSTAAHYMPPAPDGSRPGVYWVPLPGPEFDVLDVRTTVYHEAVPGHHFQMALQQESTALPRYLKLSVFGSSNAFVEGWALYAERIADEAGWYEGDPRGRIGFLGGQLLRARRLVVDTGLHTKGWTRQQAIDYGMPVSEVERYCVLPGQACGYMIGQLKIMELRERAKAALGAKFSMKAFHAVVLQTGSVPLDVLEEVVNAWIAEMK